MPKILIAYYSRAGENYFRGSIKYVKVGNTEKIAKIIQKLTGGDLLKIEQVSPYSDDYEICTQEAKRDLRNRIYPDLTPIALNPSDYEEIYLGYPNYWGSMPMAVQRFLKDNDFNNCIIHPFCTHEGSGLSNTAEEIKKLAKDAKVEKGLAVFGSDCDNAESQAKRWVEGK